MEINRRPKSLNFADAAEPCLRHMTLNYDADHDYVPYVGVTLGEKKPHFVHHRLDWSEVLPYAIYGEICARDLCGSQEGLEIEKRQRELFLRQISPLDFLIHSSSSPWSQSYKMCQRGNRMPSEESTPNECLSTLLFETSGTAES